MKKNLVLMLAAVAALMSCEKEMSEPAVPACGSGPITFDLSACHMDDTKAVKTSWEEGDAIFVFFNNVAAPKYLKMTYDGAGWTSAEYNGATPSAGAMDLKEGMTGSMRAVFLPFGSDATVSASGTSFVFSKTYYAYYLTATLDYTVNDGQVSGTFKMAIPDGYVQFFVEDPAAVDEAYSLGCDAIIPVGVASVSASGAVMETTDKTFVDDMPGYAYKGGYLFSGIINTTAVTYFSPTYYHLDDYSAEFGGKYYLAKKKMADNSRQDYFFEGEKLATHSAVKLPANDDVYAVVDGKLNRGKWIPVGSGKVVYLNGSEAWYTCNYEGNLPEEWGKGYSFDGANALPGVVLPTISQFMSLKDRDVYSLSEVTIHSQRGYVIKRKGSTEFVFIPAPGFYWTSTPGTDVIIDNRNFTEAQEPKEWARSVRPILAGDSTPEMVAVQAVSISSPSVKLVVGESIRLKATVSPSQGTPKSVFWSSSQPSVATVENGKVTAVAEGEATITAMAGGVTGSCHVTVAADEGIITFQDQDLKAALVAAFDSNGDGELSKAEAKAASNFNNVFGTTKTYKSFDEFQYFTGFTKASGFSGWYLSSIVLPESITSIEMQAFKECFKLKSISVPKDVTQIGDYAFWGCIGLDSFDIPYGVKRIEYGTFYDCSGLISVTIPRTVTYIGEKAFFGCSSLVSVTLPQGVHIFRSAFANCSSLQSIVVPNKLIYENTFSGCSGLKSVELSPELEGIYEGAFSGCSSLVSIELPETVTTIGKDAFLNCSGLQSIYVNAAYPPAGGEQMFDNTNDCPIYVPAESIEVYKAVSYWKTYADRIQARPEE